MAAGAWLLTALSVDGSLGRARPVFQSEVELVKCGLKEPLHPAQDR